MGITEETWMDEEAEANKGFTLYQESLLNEAKEEWESGHLIDTYLFMLMAAEGMDVTYLEETYYKDNN